MDPGLFQAVILKPLRAPAFVSTVAGLLHKNSRLSRISSPSPAARGGDGVAGFAAAHPLEIAVVDDNPVNLKFMRALLRTVGYDPVMFSNAPAALDSLESRKFDLVLMDIQMPGMNGHEATLRLRQGKAGSLNQHCKVIALTAGVMAEERAACLAAGMDDFVSKPVSRSELLEKLAAVAGTSRAAQPSG
jgi:CheY-like chemotaxis protein